MKHIKSTSAFTMLELIFVIIILGIVASIGSEVIVRVYQGYIMQRAQHRATLKTELAALQITNRLISAIPGTLYRIKDDNTTESIDASMGGGDTYKGLQWVASDTDTFSTSQKPGWSGFCDLNKSSKNSVITPGSNLPITVAALQNLSGLPLLGLIDRTAIYFPDDPTTTHIVDHVVMGNDEFILDSNASHMVEHYKLSWTSYALVVEDNDEGGEDLNLYYNFLPTLATVNSYSNGIKALLIHNISTFRFKITGRTMRFKICKQEPISQDVNITACKEKAVF